MIIEKRVHVEMFSVIYDFFVFVFSFTFERRIWGKTEQKLVSPVWLNSTTMSLWRHLQVRSQKTS